MVVNGAVALVAVMGLRHARRDARRAELRADAAQRELAMDRAQREDARRARADLSDVNRILELHEATLPNVVLSPLEVGRIRASLAGLPTTSVPKARALYADGANPRPSRLEVSEELHATVQELRHTSSMAF